MIKRTILSFLSLGLLSGPILASDAKANTREALAQWAQTEQMISEAENNWQLEQMMLQDSEQLLNRELVRLRELIEELEETATAADEERAELTNERDTLAAAGAVVEAEVGALETELKTIIQTYPEPLVQLIQPLIRRLPEDPAASNRSLGERVQNIVGILSQADRFNGTLTQTSESRELDDGRTVEVRTLYWGLGGAFYVDMSGNYAGVGYPTGEGWEWRPVDGAGPQIRRLLDVYEGTGDIQFVEIPASIK